MEKCIFLALVSSKGDDKSAKGNGKRPSVQDSNGETNLSITKPPSSCSWKTKEVGASCNFSRHIRKNILWFSPDLVFHVKHWCTVYVFDC